MTGKAKTGGVNIGNVSGGIRGSIISGGDVRDVTINLGGRPTAASKSPSAEEVRQLLAELREELAELAAQKEALEAISPASPSIAQGAERSVEQAATKVSQDPEPTEMKSIQAHLSEAASLLTTILDGARSVAEKAGEAQGAVQPLIERLASLVKKLAVGAMWVARLWT